MSSSAEAVWREGLAVGDRVSFARRVAKRNQWWLVRAVGGERERFVVLTQQRVGKPKGELIYTIIDWDRGVRGPCNQVGQGWDFNPEVDPDASARDLVRALEAHVEGDKWLSEQPVGTYRDMEELEVEVSYRNNVEIDIVGAVTGNERINRR